MKFGIRTPSLNKRISARTSPARFVRHSLGVKAPRGYGWITNPKKASYNRVYNRTTFKADGLIGLLLFGIIGFIIEFVVEMFDREEEAPTVTVDTVEGIFCPSCNAGMVLRRGRRGQFYGCSQYPNCRGSRDYSAEKISTERQS